MKSYVNEKQFRLVGKAWEIKHQLELLLQQGGPTMTVADYLAGLNKPEKHPSHGLPSTSRIIPFPLTIH
jgi:hypothetical protein